MRKTLLVFSCIVSCFFLIGVCVVCAEEGTSSDVVQQESTGTNPKQALSSDKQQIKEQRQEIQQNAQTARTEEDQLRDQIQAAMKSGDLQTAQKLREQLRATHQENVQGMIQDKKDIKIDMQDFRKDANAARQEGVLPLKRDNDNNPPGPMGGPGTNWENKPGPQGGPGVSPDRRPGMNQGPNMNRGVQGNGSPRGVGGN